MNFTCLSPTIRLDSSSNGKVMTPAEFDAVTEFDDAFDYELIHGVVVVNPIPEEAESDPNDELGYLLRHYRSTHSQGWHLDRTLPERYVQTIDSRRRADRVIWTGLGHAPDPQSDTPTIVIEFVSARKRDRLRDYVEKRTEYLAMGVREYWIIDRFDRTMTVIRSNETDLVIREQDVYRTPLLPGFELPLHRLIAAADDWKSAK